MLIKRGSEWRRWELHLHTPFTQKNDNYVGTNEVEKWDNFYAAIDKYIGDGSDPTRAICAIAITDYLSVDNYLKVFEDKRLPDCVELVFPNVELRIKPVSSNAPMNIHCLFSPDIAHDLSSRFFSKLKFYCNNSSYSADHSELIRLGRDICRDGNELSEKEALIKGIEQYVISFDELFNIFKNDLQLRENTIIAVSNKSTDGASGLNKHDDSSQLEATRRTIYQFSDMIFSSNPSDIKYFLGEGKDSPEIVKERCGSLKPCIHGCDAHDNKTIFAPFEDRFCWIKADPTFEGLKQILYEPKERVRICSDIPDSKPSYYVIDRVEIKGNGDFSEEPIYFNDKLTCIIGGKSTGKSLLLHNMAMAIDKIQVQQKQDTANTNVKRIPELKVFWGDGTCSNEEDKPKKIVYIPQTYLNRLSDEEQETTEIDTIIQNIVLQNKKCLNYYQSLQRNISEKKQALAKIIVDFTTIFSDKKKILENQKEIGEPSAISTEIKKLNIKLEQLSKEYDVTEIEINTYQNAIEQLQSLRNEKDVMLKERDILSGIDSIIEIKMDSNYELSIFRTPFMEAVSKSKEMADNIWQIQRDLIINNINEKIHEVDSKIEEQSQFVTKLQPKMEVSKQISKVSGQIIEEKTKITKLKDLENQFHSLQDAYIQKLNILSKSFEEFSKIYSDYVDNVNKIFETSIGDLDFSVNKVFRIERFQQKISEIINNKSFSRFKNFNLHEIKEDSLTPNNISTLIESILNDSNETLQLKGSYNIESALREILTDWYNLDYIVKMDGDNIQAMSPGKKALVLLRLLISLAESKCPILIDQPEDDLDNRSIFDELITFIRNKKIDRQIITVTHNANIVLGGDAELVIVANQDGKNAPNEKHRFEYRSGAIEDNLFIPNQGILNKKGIQEHICEILEGGKHAFELRQHKYFFMKK